MMNESDIKAGMTAARAKLTERVGAWEAGMVSDDDLREAVVAVITAVDAARKPKG